MVDVAELAISNNFCRICKDEAWQFSSGRQGSYRSLILSFKVDYCFWLFKLAVVDIRIDGLISKEELKEDDTLLIPLH